MNVKKRDPPFTGVRTGLYKKKDKFYIFLLIFAGTVNLFFATWKLVVVAYFDRRHTPGTPRNSGFCGVQFVPSIYGLFQAQELETSQLIF